MTKPKETQLKWAEENIARAEGELGYKFPNGMRRDYLADNTNWSMELIRTIVDMIDTDEDAEVTVEVSQS